VISAIIFDVFGTLLHIERRENPYRQLLRIGIRQGRAISPEDSKTIMTLDGDLSHAAGLLGIELSIEQLAKLQRMLDTELESISLFEDALPAIERLRRDGIKVGLCSNLAKPYCPVVRRLIPDLDGYALSAELGLSKPDPEIYRTVCAELEVEPGRIFGPGAQQVLMIGDSKACDVDGPRASGILGHHLSRRGRDGFRNLHDFVSAVRSESAGSLS